jgi:coenzyme F420-reducing hydrogenase beta subunit
MNQIENTLDREKFPVFAAWCLDRASRKKSASGGAFAALATRVIQNGGYVCGAVIGGLQVRLLLSNRPEDIERMQGSKYLQSSPGGIYGECLAKLKEGKDVLFTGLPCQCRAIKRYLEKKEYDGTLYVATIICSGVPTEEIVTIFKKAYPNYTRFVSFRNKENGWKSECYPYELTVAAENGQVVNLGERNIISVGYATGVFLRASCRKCPIDLQSSDTADLVMGDYWGIKDFPEEHADGISVVVCNTPHGRNLLEQAGMQLHAATFQDVVRYNPRLVVRVNYYNTVSLYLRRLLVRFFFSRPGLVKSESVYRLFLFMMKSAAAINKLDKLFLNKRKS